MITAVELPLPLQDHLRQEATRAFPRECCGLVEGVVNDGIAHVSALHPMPNIAVELDRFEIDPASHIALLRNLRGSGRAIIGCYHSHPTGRAVPSPRDRENAIESGFLWLICALGAKPKSTRIAAFLSTGDTFSPVGIVHEVPGTAGLRPAAGGTPAVPGQIA